MSRRDDIDFMCTGRRTLTGGSIEITVADCQECGKSIDLPDTLTELLDWVDGHQCRAQP